jgi:hypothetical protein
MTSSNGLGTLISRTQVLTTAAGGCKSSIPTTVVLDAPLPTDDLTQHEGPEMAH